MLLQGKLFAPNGAVAQLGERRVRNAKVGSSILLGSTNPVVAITDTQCPGGVKKYGIHLRTDTSHRWTTAGNHK